MMDWFGDGSVISGPYDFLITEPGGTQDLSYVYERNGRFNTIMSIFNSASEIRKTVEVSHKLLF